MLPVDQLTVRSDITDAVPEGWVARSHTRFDTLVGPFYVPPGDAGTQCGFLADERHANRRGVVHGGALTTAFDVALGVACRVTSSQEMHATIQLNVHFVSAMKLGEFAIVTAEMVRATRSLVFMRGIMRVGRNVIAAGDGVWKALRVTGG